MEEKTEIKSITKLPDDNNVSLEISEAFEESDRFNIGNTFLEARAQKGFTQEQASKFLKVRVKVISDFEDGLPIDLPGLTYKIGFVRSYANLLDLDSDYIVEAYKKELNTEDSKVKYNFPEAKKEKKSLYPILSLSVFLVCLISYSAWYYNSLDYIVESEIAEIKNQSIKTEDSFDYVKIENQSVKKVATLNKEDNILKQDGEKLKIDKTEQRDISLDKIIDEPLTNNKTKHERYLNNEKIRDDVLNENSAIANERDPKTELILKSTGNSWVEIEDLDGNSLITRLMRPGESYVIPKSEGLTLSTGNAGVLSLTFGKVHIPSLGQIGEVISSRPLNIEAFNQR